MTSNKYKASVISHFESNDILVITASIEGTNISKKITVANADIESDLPIVVKSVFGTQFHEISREESRIFAAFDKSVSDYLSNIHNQVEPFVLVNNLSNAGFSFFEINNISLTKEIKMNNQIEENAPEITVGMSVIYTARNGSPEERYNIAKIEGVSYGDILTVRSVSLNEKQKTVLEFFEILGQYSVSMFVQSEFWFRHCFEVGQTVVFTGRGNPSQVEYMPAQGINRGDNLTVEFIRPTDRSVYLKFKEIHGFHNGLMFVDTALWFHPV